MLDTNDIQVLREMFIENNQLIFARMDQKIDGKVDELRNEVFTKIDKKIDGLRAEIFTKMDKEFRSMYDDIIEIINDGILPQINSLSIRITRLERMQRQAAY